ncbi:hypothetical protein HPU229334_10340 [Helicobacter pullorum]|uniref:Uncharacterized protein n=1 Tax=Helicobacter pullorum TaxID=35818 RepID=A0A0N1EAE2_9HELI|nr:hypothetical protein [Helicobacter pullorum]KPH55030.1 hypothetical protein HPU229334_10340 [Helicobacter pullorum]
MDFLNLIAENGADFSKGFVIGAIIGFIAYYFWDKHKLKAMQIQVDAIKNSAEIQINTLKEQVDNYKSLLEIEKQRHQTIEESFKTALTLKVKGGI